MSRKDDNSSAGSEPAPATGAGREQLSDPREEPQRGETGMDDPREDATSAGGDAGRPTGASASASAVKQQDRDLASGEENAS